MQLLLFLKDEQRRKGLEQAFMGLGCQIDTSNNLESYIELNRKTNYTAILYFTDQKETSKIIDLKNKIRRRTDGAFIVVSGYDSGLMRARCLEAGIDAYFIEPVSLIDILFEIYALSYAPKIAKRQVVVANDFVIDPLARSVYLCEEELILSKNEFDLLVKLVTGKNQVFSRYQLSEVLYGEDEYIPGNRIDVCVNRLKKKLPKPYANYIRAVRGIGYIFKNP